MAAASDNAATIRAFIDAWQRLDVDELVGYFTDDGVYHNMPMGPAEGRAAVRELIGGVVGSWSSAEWEITNLVAEGDIVVAERVDRADVGGKPLALPCLGIFEMRDGKIARWRDYFDMDSYRRAVS